MADLSAERHCARLAPRCPNAHRPPAHAALPFVDPSRPGIDVRVVMISGQKDGMPAIPVHLDGVCIGAPLGSGMCPADSNAPGYTHVVVPLADWDMLQQYIDAYPMYRRVLREHSWKTFVSISDSDISSNIAFQLPIGTADTFIAAVERQVMQVVTLACDWEIPATPAGETFDAGKTNVQLTLDGTTEQLGKAQRAADCGARDGWRYDDDAAPQRVVACPSTCTRIQAALDAQVDLLFGCETVALPPVE